MIVSFDPVDEDSTPEISLVTSQRANILSHAFLRTNISARSRSNRERKDFSRLSVRISDDDDELTFASLLEV